MASSTQFDNPFGYAVDDVPVVVSRATILAMTDDLDEEEARDQFGMKPLSTSTKMWNCSNAEIGLVGVQMTTAGRIYYELFVSFPDVHKEWSVRRSYDEFYDLHRALSKTHSKYLDARGISLPKRGRVEWNWTWSHEARATHAARRLKLKLNAYLHRLLELHDVHTSHVFRAFFDFREQDMVPTSSLKQLDLGSTLSPMSPTESSSSTDEAASTTTTLSLSSLPSTSTASAPAEKRRASDHHVFQRGSDRQLQTSLNLGTHTSSHVSTMDPVVLHALRRDAESMLPPPSVVVKMTSDCSAVVHYGQSISLRARGGLVVGLQKRSAWSGSQRVAAVGAVAAGITLLSGPIGLTIGALGSLGKHQLSKTSCLSTTKRELAKHDEFLIEVAEAFSSPSRVVHYGDVVRLVSVSRRQYVRVAVPSDSKRGYLGVASGGKGTCFKWISPLGYRGPVVCGSPVCLQVADADSPWADEVVAVHKDFVTTDGSPATFKIGLFNHPCMANADVARTVTRPMPKSVTVRIAVYNVWLLPPIVTTFANVSPYKLERSAAIPDALQAACPELPDAVVFCEAFDDAARTVLAAGMKRLGYIYETRVAGQRGNIKALTSGVFAMSRYPIEAADELLFGGTSVGDDKAADKGAIYFELRKGGEVIHVVGTHLQAWESPGAVATRKKQLALMAQWVADKKLPRRDALIYAGDFNIDKTNEAAVGEFNTMLSALQAKDPPVIADSSNYSFDPETNILSTKGASSGGKQERLDYVMYAAGHREPHTAKSRVLPVKAAEGWDDTRNVADGALVVDLSDHYPVVSEFHFG
ncbi:hypothetical protein ACHHYP_16724 [Achlya hypogyna]|uniref:sphingomyelin phosphodiesterase n=1 Tax=Achlya hypogyna TaxID=1202772 RepID=A0A1V9Y5W9_ACHHY|nr:hypothetical protein ACHHYP_16724 [Achlya hypogyna]